MIADCRRGSMPSSACISSPGESAYKEASMAMICKQSGIAMVMLALTACGESKEQGLARATKELLSKCESDVHVSLSVGQWNKYLTVECTIGKDAFISDE